MLFLLKCKKNCVDHNSDFEDTSVSRQCPKRQRLERQGFREPTPHVQLRNSRALCSSSAVTALNQTCCTVMLLLLLLFLLLLLLLLRYALPCKSDVGSREWGNTFQGENTHEHMHFHNTHTAPRWVLNGERTTHAAWEEDRQRHFWKLKVRQTEIIQFKGVIKLSHQYCWEMTNSVAHFPLTRMNVVFFNCARYSVVDSVFLCSSYAFSLQLLF